MLLNNTCRPTVPVNLHIYHQCHLVGGCSNNGLTEPEMDASISTLHAVSAACDADMTVLRKKGGEGSILSDCLIRRKVTEDDFLEVRYD